MVELLRDDELASTSCSMISDYRHQAFGHDHEPGEEQAMGIIWELLTFSGSVLFTEANYDEHRSGETVQVISDRCLLHFGECIAKARYRGRRKQ